jgi:dihydroflavonol-4-reductase
VGDIFTSPNPDHREAAIRVNVDGTVNVLRAAHEAGAKRVVVTSSSSTRYQIGGAPANEDSPAVGDTIVPDPYVTSKVRLESAIADFSRQTGLEVVAILAGGLVGPRDAYPKLMGKNVLARLNGETTAGIGLEGAFPFVDVRDVARAHVKAMEIENPREAYLVVADSISLEDWSTLFNRVTGLPIKGLIIPAKLAMPMALGFEAVAWLKRKPAMMNRNAVRHSIHCHCQHYDTSRAREELGITYTPPETTIRDTARWFVDNGYVTNKKNLAILRKTVVT